MIKSPKSFALNSSTYTAITLGDDDAFGFAVYAVDESGDMAPFYYATDETGTDEVIAPTIGLAWPHYEKQGGTVLYAKSISGTPDLVLNPAVFVKF